jgi:hypothetical protein
MLTAKDAINLTKQSQKIPELLDLVMAEITRCAKNGEVKVTYLISDEKHSFNVVDIVANQLRSLGYKVNLSFRRRSYENDSLCISWEN